MPRCLMAKKWKAYQWPDRNEDDHDTAVVMKPEPHTFLNNHHLHQQLPAQPMDEDEEIDVVGDDNINTTTKAAITTITTTSTTTSTTNCSSTCWSPSSPTAGTTAPSPPPHSPEATTVLYNGNYAYFFPKKLVRPQFENLKIPYQFEF